MTPTPGQWQDLLDAIANLAPDPFWTTAIPILTTLFAVFGGFALAQWREASKAKRERRDKRLAEVREQRSNLVDYMTRWSHGTDRPGKQALDLVHWEQAAEEVALLVSLTGETRDAPLAHSLRNIMGTWILRTYAAPMPKGALGQQGYFFNPLDESEMQDFRTRLLAILRQWLDGAAAPSDAATELTALNQDLMTATRDRKDRLNLRGK
jgi:hypothetical protein